MDKKKKLLHLSDILDGFPLFEFKISRHNVFY